MSSKAARHSPGVVGVAAASAAAGLVLNRLNVGIFGYFRDAGTIYLPSLAEWALSLGVIAAAGLIFLYGAENLPIFGEGVATRDRFSPDFDRFSGVWRMTLASGLNRASLLAVVVVPVAWVALFPPSRDEGRRRRPVRPPVAEDAERTVLRIDGDLRGVAVVFPHEEHQRRLGGKTSCTRCHHLSLPADHSTPCSRCHRDMERPTTIFDHTAHFEWVARRDRLRGWIPGNMTCGECHPAHVPKSAEGVRPCLDCHGKDMTPSRRAESPLDLMQADGYRVAFHENCIPCHEEEAQKVGRPNLGDCATCHETLRRSEAPATAPVLAARLR
jgi:hypothetical protein